MSKNNSILIIDLCNTMYSVNTWYELVKWSGGKKTHYILNNYLFKVVNYVLDRLFDISLSRFVLAKYSKLYDKNIDFLEFFYYLNSNFLNKNVLDVILKLDCYKIIVSGTNIKIAKEIASFYKFDQYIATVLDYDVNFKLFNVNIYKDKCSHIDKNNLSKFKTRTIISDNYSDFKFCNYGFDMIAISNSNEDNKYWSSKEVSCILQVKNGK